MSENKKRSKLAETLHEACANGDGTYNGVKALKWLADVLHPGNDLTGEEIQEIWDSERLLRQALKGGKE